MDVRMPDGTIISNVPDDITQTELLRRYERFKSSASTSETRERAAPPQEERSIIGDIVDPFTKAIPQRVAEIGASLTESVQRGTEFLGKKMEASLTPEERAGLAKAKEKVPVLNQIQPEQVFRSMEQTAQNLRDYSESIGYTPTDTLGDLGDNPLKVFRFVYQRVIQSTPDMAAAVLANPAYVYARTNEILNDRLVNDKKELKDATVEDVTKSLAGAVIEANLEKFATGRLFKPGTGKSVAGRISKEAGIQGGTEMLEEGASYIAGTQGTKKGVDPQELAEVMAEAGIVGVGLGSSVQGAKEIVAKRDKKKKEPEPIEGSKTAPPVAKAPVVPTANEIQDTAAMLAELEGQQLATQGLQQQITDQDFADKMSQAKDIIIQNRNRATPASIAQMTDIANNLDYDKVSFSKTFNDGAPVVNDAVQLNPKLLGRQSTITAADGRKIPVQYAVVPADSIIASNNMDGTPNTEFFNPDSPYAKAVAGNARTAAIQGAYRLGKADAYKKAMLEDTDHGIDPKVIKATNNPVLVRVMPNDQITADIGDISNTATNLNLSVIEQAKNDANRIDLQGLQYDPNGDLTLTGIRDFVNAMPTTERANLIDQNGVPTRQAFDRIEAAVFQKAYNNDNLTSLAHQAQDPEARNIIKGLVEAAPQMSRLEGAGEYDLRPQLAQAAELAVNARRAGNKLSDVVAQQDMTADPLTYDFLQMFADNPRSAKAIGENLKRFANTAYEQTQEGGVDMFGERQMMPVTDVLAQSFAPQQQDGELPLGMVTEADIQKAQQTQEIRDDMINEYRRIKQRKAAIERRFVKEKSKKMDMFEFKNLAKQADMLRQEIAESYTPNVSPEAFLARAAKALANEEISRDVYDIIDKMYKKNPNILRGLRLSIKMPSAEPGLSPAMETAGMFKPYSRIVDLYKGTKGIEDPMVIRHELTHSLEQMMPKEARLKLVDAWKKAVLKAERTQTTEEGKAFFDGVRELAANPSPEAMDTVINMMPSSEYYQYITPSEFWAVNAEPLLGQNLGGAWQRFKKSIRQLYEFIKDVLNIDNRYLVHRIFNQVVNGERVTTAQLNNYIGSVLPMRSVHRNYAGKQAPLASWNMPDDTKMDQFLYKIQDKNIDTRRAIQSINAQVGAIDDQWDAYLKEELYHGRTAKRVRDFLTDDLRPIVQEIDKNNINLQEFDDYLHNRHAEERNIQIAKINPAFPDGGSGINTADAQQYLSSLDPKKRALYEQLANKVDDIVKGTQDILVNSGLETQQTVDTWNNTYKHYVPLMREDLDFSQKYTGLGAGFSTKGAASKRAFGSKKDVADIFANIAAQRERAIVRSEKARVGRAMYGLAIKNPNPDFWLPINPDAIKNTAAMKAELMKMGLDPADADSLMQEPKTPYIDPLTGLVAYRVNPIFRNSDNVFPVRINGQDRFIFFNPNDERAIRMARAIKNLDAQELGWALGNAAKVTRWIASVNTQYNPVFGAYNFIRDVGGAQFNLTTTAIKGEQAKVVANVFPALRGIFQDLRQRRGTGQPATSNFAKLWEDFQQQGGATGYRDQFSKNRNEQNILEQELAGLNHGNIRKGVKGVFNWLSDYNDAMENAVRLAAYKVALDKGLTKERAASLAKNLTVNFNRKGDLAQQVGALYAFFNASVQGTTRLMETLKGPQGRKIMAGGVLLGSIQAVALAAMGFDDNEPPEFVKERNLVIPFPNGTYIAIPMPLGLHVIPNIGRITTEMVLTSGKDADKKVLNLFNTFLGAFNPIGNAGMSMQTFAPTGLDPIAGIMENRDNFGRPIARQDRATNPTPGYTRTRDTASWFSKELSYYLNLASGGTKYQKGAISPTPDQIDYLIGQATGGVGREIMKAEQTVTSALTGEELPSYKIPLVGRFYGDTSSQAAQANLFYDNITKMANHENEIKGRMKNRENTTEYLRDNPEARLWRMANRIENEISDLNRQKKDLIAKNASKEQVQRIEQIRTRKMEQFNKTVRDAESR